MCTNNHANPSQTLDIVFRKKFERQLTDSNRYVITRAVRRFCKFCKDDAIKLLWHMTCGFKFLDTFDPLGLTVHDVDDVISFRNELRFQYELRHHGFLNVDVPDSCLGAFTALKNKTDSIVAYVVYNYCVGHLSLNRSEVLRTLYLMGSDLIRFRSGGINNMSSQMKQEEVHYLTTFAPQIHDLLNALYDDMITSEVSSPVQQEDQAEPTSDTSDLPFYFGTQTDKEDDAPHFEPATDFEHLSATKILAHQEVLSTLLSSEMMNTLILLRENHFDLNEVVSKREKILRFIQSSNSLFG